MARKAADYFTLPDGKRVGYGLKDRAGVWRVQFKHPTENKYIEYTTGCSSKSDAYLAAAKIVLKNYLPTLPPDPLLTGWDDVLTHLAGTPDLRPDSVRAYVTAVNAVRELTETKGPQDITESTAHEWKRNFLSGTYAKSDAPDAKRYKRSPVTCTTYLRCLRSLWKKHFQPAGFVRSNPWASVPYPNTPKGKRVRMPEADAVADLMKWLPARHPGWELPLLFIQVKMLAGCRTLDMCKTASADLNGTTLTLTEWATKTRTRREVVLAAKLHAVKGAKWLWEVSVRKGRYTARRSAPTTRRTGCLETTRSGVAGGS